MMWQWIRARRMTTTTLGGDTQDECARLHVTSCHTLCCWRANGLIHLQ
jgi:hypothetical protein